MNKNLRALAFFALVSVIFLLPLFNNFSNWGFYDWDQHMFYHGSARTSLLKFHQFPLWNPFYCGGNVLLANPQSTFLSPFFLFVLMFGEVYGLKLEAMAYLVVGLFGMFLLARRLGIKGYAAYFAAVLFMLSSWFSLHVTVGHTTFLPFALLPYAVLFYLKSLDSKRFIPLSAFFLVMMILAGGIYPFYFAAVFLLLYALLEALESRKIRAVAIIAAVFLVAFLLGAVKLLPMLEFVWDTPSKADDQLNSPSFLLSSLFSRNQVIKDKDVEIGRPTNISDEEKYALMMQAKVPWGWHEYGAYVGVIPLLLALLSFIGWRRNWKLILLAAFFLLLSLGNYSPINVWLLFQKLPFVGALHGPSRFIIMFVFCISILAAKGLSGIRLPRKRAVALLVTLAVAADLMLVSRPIMADAFPIEPLDIDTYEYRDYIQVFVEDPYVAQYPYMLQNLGTVNCYERVHPKIKASYQVILESATLNPYFVGNAYIKETNESLPLAYFSPNKVTVSTAGKKGTLVLNQNYLAGWKSKGRQVSSSNGLISTALDGEEEITFYYLPNTFIFGAIISLITFIICILYFRKCRQ